MALDVVSQRAEELARTVGPIETLVALARVEDALELLDDALGDDVGGTGDGSQVIDLREVRSVMARIQPLFDMAEARIGDLRATLDNLS